MSLGTLSAEYLFHQGTNCRVYEYLGCHYDCGGYVFRVWAPHATRVYLVGDFCDWQNGLPMRLVTAGGVWECKVFGKRIKSGDFYKFKIISGDRTLYKADPYAFEAECPPLTASVVCDISYNWRDDGWLAYRQQNARSVAEQPMNVYELHLGTWRVREDGSTMSFSEVAVELAPYVKQMGYTHVQILPVWECIKDGSLGYAPSSYFAPSALQGGGAELKAFVDRMHEAGIGVILDWSPMMPDCSESGICRFDGQPLYERADGSAKLDTSKREVRSFLLSNASFWINEYHFDGLCAESIDDSSFVELFMRTIKSQIPDVLLIAKNGDGRFDMTWNKRWSVVALKMLGDENFNAQNEIASLGVLAGRNMLALSYEALCGEGNTIMEKAEGKYSEKFDRVRALLGFMMTFPGKKLTFMSNEIGQFKKWNGQDSVEWFLLEYETHAKIQRYAAELGQFYLQTPALWQTDGSWEGYEPLENTNKEQGIISYRRKDRSGGEVIVIINLANRTYENFRLGVPYQATYREIINSDDKRYGGSGVVNTDDIASQRIAWNWQENSITVRVPPLAVSILKCVGKTQSKRKTSKASKTKIIK